MRAELEDQAWEKKAKQHRSMRKLDSRNHTRGHTGVPSTIISNEAVPVNSGHPSAFLTLTETLKAKESLGSLTALR